MVEKMTCSKYGELRGISKQAVAKAIRKKHRLPGVVSFEMIGRQYTLLVDTKKLK